MVWGAALPGSAQLSFTPTTFGDQVAVGSTSSAVTLTLMARSAGAITSIPAFTGGKPHLDFAITGGTCALNQTLRVGDTCTVNITFSPYFPGVRQGAVALLSGGQVLASAPLSGIAKGGLPVLVPADIKTVAGDSQWFYQSDGVPATQTSIFLPTGLAVNAAGELYLCDSSNNRVRYVDSNQVIHTLAGTGTPGGLGDGGAASTAELNDPSGLALDGAGNLYIADTKNNVVRRIDAVSGVITTVAGQMGVKGFAGDGGAATSALLNAPQGLALTPGGDLVIADSGNNRVRQLTLASGQIQTIAGTGTAGFNSDNIPATSAQLYGPYGVAVRSDGAVAIADTGNNRVRLISLSGTITTIAGDGQATFGGDKGAATQAQLYGPESIAFDPAGDLFIADSGNNRIRGVFGSPGVIVTLAGNDSTQFSGDGGPDNQASLYGPAALAFDYTGNLWISDFFHNRVREITGSVLDMTFPAMKVGKISAHAIDGTLYNGGNTNLTLHTPTLDQAQFDTQVTTCNTSPMAPMSFCNMGIDFAPTQVSSNDTGSVTWTSDAPNVAPVDALNGEVLSVEPTSVAINANINPGLLGQPVVLTATVTSDDTGRTGTVTFTEGNHTWCNAVGLDSNGTASCNIPSLALGTHNFVASYSGDNNNAGSTSQPYAELIKQQPALALAVSTSPAVVTSNVTLSLKAADPSGTGTPTGTVIFFDGGTALATVSLNNAGIAQWSTQTLGVGTHSLSAQYSGDGANAGGTSNSVPEQITQANTVTVLASNSSTPMIGMPLTLTATVFSNSGPAPAGVVQFTEGAGPNAPVIGSAVLGGDGKASITTNTLAPGAHSIVAVYGGDTDDAKSSSAALPETVQATGITLVSSSNPAVSGQSVSFHAQLDQTGPQTPTGMAILHDDGTFLASAPFSSTGLVSFTTAALSVGTHVITVSYAGDSNFAPSGGELNQSILEATTAIALSASASPAVYGQPLSLAAVVTSNGGTATGTVNFTEGGNLVGSAQLDSAGMASLVIATLPPGLNTLTASYAGDGKASQSVSPPVSVVVKQTTAIAVTSNSNPALTLSSVLLTATVSNAGAAAATGPIAFTDGGVPIGTAQLDGSGHATLTLPQMSAGTHAIAASFAGDGSNFASASGVFKQAVQLRPTEVTLTGSSTDPANPQQVTLIAVVKGQGSTAPTGTVSFTSGNLTLGQAAIDVNGVATITVIFEQTSLPMLVSYTGDANYTASKSASTTITAGQPAQFTLAVSAPNVTLVTHQHTSVTISLGSVKGFTDTIALGCLGLPFAGTCTFTPSQVKLSPDGVTTATLLLDTGNPLGAGTGTTAAVRNGRNTLLCCLPVGLLLGLLQRRKQRETRRRLGTLAALCLGFVVMMNVAGCSGLSTSGTPPGTYTFKIVGTGQGSGTTQAQTVTLVVTQ